MTQDALDEQCLRWRHHERRVEFCVNRLCPGRDPKQLADDDAVPDVTGELERDPGE